MIPVYIWLGADSDFNLPKVLFYAPKLINLFCKIFAVLRVGILTLFLRFEGTTSECGVMRTTGMASRKCIVMSQPRPSALGAKSSTANFASRKEYNCKFTMTLVNIRLGADFTEFESSFSCT